MILLLTVFHHAVRCTCFSAYLQVCVVTMARMKSWGERRQQMTSSTDPPPPPPPKKKINKNVTATSVDQTMRQLLLPGFLPCRPLPRNTVFARMAHQATLCVRACVRACALMCVCMCWSVCVRVAWWVKCGGNVQTESQWLSGKEGRRQRWGAEPSLWQKARKVCSRTCPHYNKRVRITTNNFTLYSLLPSVQEILHSVKHWRKGTSTSTFMVLFSVHIFNYRDFMMLKNVFTRRVDSDCLYFFLQICCDLKMFRVTDTGVNAWRLVQVPIMQFQSCYWHNVLQNTNKEAFAEAGNAASYLP